MKTLRRATLAVLVLVVAASIGHRLWLQYRPLSLTTCMRRPMTQAEWAMRAGTNTPMPTNCFMIDETPYPPPGQPAPVSAKDIRRIRALSTWGALMPFRTVRVQVWNSTNVTLAVFERYTTELAFMKDATGWHMERIGGQIDWVSEDAKPVFSFH